MRLRIIYGDLMIRPLQRKTYGQTETVAECPKVSVLGHTNAVIAVYILFQRITKYILYRFKVTGSLHFASDLQYSPARIHLSMVGDTAQHLCQIISGDVLLQTRWWVYIIYIHFLAHTSNRACVIGGNYGSIIC